MASGSGQNDARRREILRQHGSGASRDAFVRQSSSRQMATHELLDARSCVLRSRPEIGPAGFLLAYQLCGARIHGCRAFYERFDGDVLAFRRVAAGRENDPLTHELRDALCVRTKLVRGCARNDPWSDGYVCSEYPLALALDTAAIDVESTPRLTEDDCLQISQKG